MSGLLGGFPGGLVVKNPPANAGDARDRGFDHWVRKIGNVIPLQSLAWRIPCTEEPGGLWGHKESDMTEHTWIAYCIPGVFTICQLT